MSIQDKLRTVGQGADTITWLAIVERSKLASSGDFYQVHKNIDFVSKYVALISA